jgi:DNA-binding IclR family transcriptional regulator
MAYTYHELKSKTVQDLRAIAKETNHEAVQGALQMNKEHLLPALCKALGIDAHEHHAAAGIDKAGIKTRMRELKKKKLAAIAARDHESLKSLRRNIHSLNRQIRSHLQ